MILGTDDKTHLISFCKGAESGKCPLALPLPEEFMQRLEIVVADAGWAEFLHSRLGRRVRHHHMFQIAVSGCANGCSRPHIADLGLIAACALEQDATNCTACGDCAASCPDAAIVVEGSEVRIDATRCLHCGRCAAACSSSALRRGQTEFRVLVGGKLGRRPCLAHELAGSYDPETTLAVLKRCLIKYMDAWRPDRRFADLVTDASCLQRLAGGGSR